MQQKENFTERLKLFWGRSLDLPENKRDSYTVSTIAFLKSALLLSKEMEGVEEEPEVAIRD
jgi:hypothetical protein